MWLLAAFSPLSWKIKRYRAFLFFFFLLTFCQSLISAPRSCLDFLEVSHSFLPHGLPQHGCLLHHVTKERETCQQGDASIKYNNVHLILYIFCIPLIGYKLVTGPPTVKGRLFKGININRWGSWVATLEYVCHIYHGYFPGRNGGCPLQNKEIKRNVYGILEGRDTTHEIGKENFLLRLRQ